MRRINMDEIINELTQLMVNDKEEVLYCLTDDTYIFKGVDGGINPKYENAGYKIFNLGQRGGTIIGSKGDIQMALFKFEGWNQAKSYVEKMANYLKLKGLNVTFVDNDILIDKKYKVISFGSKDLGNRKIFATIQISLTADPNLINSISAKPMDKIPRGLSYYGITTEEMEDLIIKLANEIN